ncbi:GNAT family N-acetyltransferase [Myxococcus xanthus]|uniref:GNAT family N-acetyltransferase n=2 Tax=Myxococcus xanthus TaxID=34 RepID=A0A7Y4MQ18_MYXXA|nr:GNAT family N-acetyltransferase [Myxococcus xanthus]NOJ88322.1 GNAT family N-acetyltransferase [Myxococcus xanthus]
MPLHPNPPGAPVRGFERCVCSPPGGACPTLQSPMTNAELSARLLSNVIAFKHLQRERGTLRHLGLPGVDAFCLPGHPELSRAQQAFFHDPGALRDALPALTDFYLRLDLPGWRVVLLPGDTEGRRVLEDAGFAPDAVRSDTLGLVLGDVPDAPPDIPLESSETQDDMVAINKRTWGQLGGQLDVWLRPPRLPVHTLVAKEAGVALACGMARDVGDTAGIYMVATVPEARGRGLAAQVMRGLHHQARSRGMTAAVLEATPEAKPLYQRLGYRDLGAWETWGRTSR